MNRLPDLEDIFPEFFQDGYNFDENALADLIRQRWPGARVRFCCGEHTGGSSEFNGVWTDRTVQVMEPGAEKLKSYKYGRR
jgi:hypothetical protein